jgi:hypothetical protein
MRAGNRAESKDERNQRRAVANVFASKAIAALPLLRRSPMMPEPTTSSAVLSSSPIRRRGVVMSNSLARSSPSIGHMFVRYCLQRAKGSNALQICRRSNRVCQPACRGSRPLYERVPPPGECSPCGISRGSHPIEARLFCRSDGVEHVEPSHASTL